MTWGGADDNGKRREGASDDGSAANVVHSSNINVTMMCCFVASRD